MKKFTHSFKISKIHEYEHISNHSILCQTDLNVDVLRILSQKFNYLDRGAQSYCFESEDQKYVLKIYRSDHRLLNKSHNSKNPKPFLESLTIAEKHLKQETKLICSSISGKNLRGIEVQLTSPLGSVFSLNLEHCIFIIQKKVHSFKDAILEDLVRNDDQALYEKFFSIFQLLSTRLEKGIENLDPELSSNFGFDGNQAVEIDLGNFAYYDGVLCKTMDKYLHLVSTTIQDLPCDKQSTILKAYQDVMSLGSIDEIADP